MDKKTYNELYREVAWVQVLTRWGWGCEHKYRLTWDAPETGAVSMVCELAELSLTGDVL